MTNVNSTNGANFNDTPSIGNTSKNSSSNNKASVWLESDGDKYFNEEDLKFKEGTDSLKEVALRQLRGLFGKKFNEVQEYVNKVLNRLNHMFEEYYCINEDFADVYSSAARSGAGHHFIGKNISEYEGLVAPLRDNIYKFTESSPVDYVAVDENGTIIKEIITSDTTFYKEKTWEDSNGDGLPDTEITVYETHTKAFRSTNLGEAKIAENGELLYDFDNDGIYEAIDKDGDGTIDEYNLKNKKK